MLTHLLKVANARGISVGWLIAATLIPGVIAVAGLFYQVYRIQEAALEQGALQTARALMQAVDRDFGSEQGKLEVLALSPYLDSGDLKAFHDQAVAIAQGEPGGTSVGGKPPLVGIVISAPNGDQVVNSRLPYGTPLPKAGGASSGSEVYRTRQPKFYDLFIGGALKIPLVGIGVPVIRNDRVTNDLTISFPPERTNRVLLAQNLPKGWFATVFDSTGAIVARSEDIDQYLGKKAEPGFWATAKQQAEGAMAVRALDGTAILRAYNRSSYSHWTVSVSVRKSVLYANVLPPLGLVLLSMLAFAAATALMTAWARDVSQLKVTQEAMRTPLSASTRSWKALGHDALMSAT